MPKEAPVTFVTIAPGRRLARPAALSYERMQAWGMPAGGINSAHRPHEEQRRLFLARYRQQASGNGPYGDVRWYQGRRYVRHSSAGSVAVPGGPTSRHESGLALDIASASAAHAWIKKHGRAHGWVADVPGEPWHFEYRQKHDKHYGQSPRLFADVPMSHKFAKDIAWMKEAGITNGWKDGTFRPKDAVTREAMAAFLYRLAGRPAVKLPAKSPFRDVKPGSQFYREIIWLEQSRITTGYADGTFRPKANIARDAMAAFLYRASGAVFTPPSKPSFKDVPKTAQFYREIEWLRSEGITTGYAGRKYKPYEPISREATAAFLNRYSN